MTFLAELIRSQIFSTSGIRFLLERNRGSRHGSGSGGGGATPRVSLVGLVAVISPSPVSLVVEVVVVEWVVSSGLVVAEAVPSS